MNQKGVHEPKRNARTIMKSKARTVKRVRSLAGSPVVMGMFSFSRAVILKSSMSTGAESGEALAAVEAHSRPSHAKCFIRAKWPHSPRQSWRDGETAEVEQKRGCLTLPGDPQGARGRVLFKGALGMTCAAYVERSDEACPLFAVP